MHAYLALHGTPIAVIPGKVLYLDGVQARHAV